MFYVVESSSGETQSFLERKLDYKAKQKSLPLPVAAAESSYSEVLARLIYFLI